MKNMNLLGSKEASKMLGIHPRTLYLCEKILQCRKIFRE